MVACSSILAGVIPRTEEPGVIVDRVAKNLPANAEDVKCCGFDP